MHIRLPHAMARFNRAVTNRVMGLWAPYLPPWAVVLHRGRRTGRAYRTVVWAFVRRGTVVVALTYGRTDWLRNVLAAGGGEVVRLGRPRTISNPRVIAAADRNALPRGTRWTARVFGSALAADLS